MRVKVFLILAISMIPLWYWILILSPQITPPHPDESRQMTMQRADSTRNSMLTVMSATGVLTIIVIFFTPLILKKAKSIKQPQ